MKYIKDEEFIRGNSPMTKENIRILSIAKMCLDTDSKVLDIGAGTGSISIQASKISKKGKVIAIEKEDKALEVLIKNKEKFNCNNLNIIEGEALEISENIKETFDAIFIGGSGGNIKEIIKIYSKKLKPEGIMVLNFITIGNLYKSLETLKKLHMKTEFIQVSISNGNRASMLVSNNPIFIVTAEKA